MVTAKHARFTGIVILAIVFAVGALTGAATMRVVDADEPPVRMRAQKERPNLLERLELTPEQRVQVDAILERRRAEMEEFWEEHRPTVRAIADSARAELRLVLTPEQRAIEERFMAERRQHYGGLEMRGSGQW
jgi:Spy/CpxP family protein refolding chaperone